VLLLAYVALRQGDAAGLMTFADSEPRFVPPPHARATPHPVMNTAHDPRKPPAPPNAFMNPLYDAQPTRRPPDYHAAAVELSRRLKRRSLVIVLSNLRDEDEETLFPARALLERKHLVLFANLRESALDRVRTEPVKDLEDALRYA